MNKISELASILVTKYDLSQKDAESFVESMFDVINERLQNNEKQVKIKGLGTFKLTSVSSRESVDVNTGERIVIEGRNKISFTPDTTLKERVNLPFAQFETVVINDGIDFSDLDSEKEETESETNASSASEQTTVNEVANNTDVLIASVVTEENKETDIEEKPIASSSDAPAKTDDIDVKIEENDSTEDDAPSLQSHQANEYESEDDNSGNQMEENTGNKKLIYVLLSIIVIQMVLLIYGGYYFNDQLSIRDERIQQMDKNLKYVQNKLNGISKVVTVNNMSLKNNLSIGADSVHKTDTTKTVTPKVVQDKINIDKTATNYNKDPRVRTGAYVIEGIAQRVTVKKGETLTSLSKRHLGPGMECYVEAVNDKKEFKEGNKINIPKLRHKRIKKPNEW